MSALEPTLQMERQIRGILLALYDGREPQPTRLPGKGSLYQALFCVSCAHAASIGSILGMLELGTWHPEVFSNPVTNAELTVQAQVLVSAQAALERFCAEELGQDYKHVMNLSEPNQLRVLGELAPVLKEFQPITELRERHFQYLIETWRSLTAQPEEAP